jgi:uncharacterized protein YndB with AHSA1/START domain
MTFPVLLGRGKRWYGEDAQAGEWEQLSSRTSTTGVIMSRYRPKGPVRTGSFAHSEPSAVERARRARMAAGTMVTGARTVSVSRRIAAAPERVFDAWLDPEGLGGWLFRTPDGELVRVEVDPRVGGGFRVDERRGGGTAEHHGEYVALDRPRRLAFDFWTSLSDERTRVTIEIVPDGDGSLLTLTHEGVWADYQARTRQGWTMILEGLERQFG